MRTLTAAVIFSLAASAAAAEEGRSSGGCVVRRTTVDAEGIGTFHSECRWPIAHELVQRVFQNRELLASENSSLAESRELPDGRVVNVHSVGFPIADRQVTLESVSETLPDGGLRDRYWKSERQEPLAKGRVQVRIDEGVWEIRPDGAGGTLLTYEMRYDPGGNLEPWLVRRFQTAGIERSLAELRVGAERLAAKATPGTGAGAPTSE